MRRAIGILKIFVEGDRGRKCNLMKSCKNFNIIDGQFMYKDKIDHSIRRR